MGTPTRVGCPFFVGVESYTNQLSHGAIRSCWRNQHLAAQQSQSQTLGEHAHPAHRLRDRQ